ncbi:MAG: hypothetical protein GDA43_21265 [Hormoscilla sp. SP5CHS1]|nr:hypothetical protein [Hormoscilla sp. SP5CHS1]
MSFNLLFDNPEARVPNTVPMDELTGNRYHGSNGHDRYRDGDEHDHLNGGRGNDSLDSGSENDFLIGGDGHDHLSGQFDNDTLVGGYGYDTLYGGFIHWRTRCMSRNNSKECLI